MAEVTFVVTQGHWYSHCLM